MRAVRIHAFGDSRQLRVEELAVPTPGRGEVLVAIRRVGVNPIDWKIRQGIMAQRTPLPLTLGQDFAGEVAGVGPHSGSFQVGQRVYGFAKGAYAEFALAAMDEIAAMPEGISWEMAAALPTPGLTAYQLVTRATALQSGQTVLIHGAAGAVGTLAVRLARHRGVRVLATDLARELGYLRELGVEHAWDAAGTAWESEVGSVEAVIALVDGELLRRSYALVQRGGVVASSVGGLDEAEAARRGLRAVAFVMHRSGADLAAVGELAGQGVLRLRIASLLALGEAQRAQDMSQQGGVEGKIVLRAA